jgi:dihydrofolate reductase
MGSEALLLGRKTYEGFAAAWPERDGGFADKFNTMPKYVVSTTLGEPEWANTTVIDGDLSEAVATIKQRHDGDVVVHGSATLVQALLENDLVDALHLMVFPRRAGGGQARLRPHERQEAPAPHGLADGRRRRRDPHVRTAPGGLTDGHAGGCRLLPFVT